MNLFLFTKPKPQTYITLNLETQIGSGWTLLCVRTFIHFVNFR